MAGFTGIFATIFLGVGRKVRMEAGGGKGVLDDQLDQ